MARIVLGIGTSHGPLLSTPPDQWHQRVEVRNWLPVTAACGAAGLAMELVDYVPCYRSAAGTGNAMGFVTWQ